MEDRKQLEQWNAKARIERYEVFGLFDASDLYSVLYARPGWRRAGYSGRVEAKVFGFAFRVRRRKSYTNTALMKLLTHR